jgi:hypothetical protein
VIRFRRFSLSEAINTLQLQLVRRESRLSTSHVLIVNLVATLNDLSERGHVLFLVSK